MSEALFSLDRKFFEDLNSQDETGLLVRTHSHVEIAVREYISQHVPFPEHLPRFSYETTVRVACALGLNDRYLPPLKAVGKLRNEFGHKHDASLNEANVAKLLSSFSAEDREWIVTCYETLRERGALNGPQYFRELPPANKFGLIALALRIVLARETPIS